MILGWIFFLWVHGGGVRGCYGGGGRGWGLLWVICGFMVVKVGVAVVMVVAMGFEAEVSGVAVGW